ncbi:MAG: alpha/beta fold hydrolase, partial [Proteobacteria bacterium]|nr:alpha/beta fold hydrolase [Pseudomonadota bacterium]
FVRLSSTSENPESPIFYLAPGPGGSGIQAARSNYAFFAMLREISDVIVFDQRGTGETDLSCPERVFLPIDRSLPYEEVLSVFIWELQRCKEYWEVQGIDLKGYTTIESAHDVNKLRAKLGINKISLVGSSYGSHYALTILKYYGNTIDRVVISGIEGPDHTLSLPSDFDRHLDDINLLVQSHPTLGKDIPNLREMLREVIDRLDGNPVSVRIENDQTNENEYVQIGKFEIQLLMYSLLGRDRSIGQVPKLVYDMYNDEYLEVAKMIYQLKSRGQSISAMLIMMDGSSGASAQRLNRLQIEDNATTLGPVVHFLFPELALAWEVPELGPEFLAPVTSDRPVLIVSGSMDARTPISNGDEVAQGLSNSHHLIVQNAGHPPPLMMIENELRDFLQGRPITANYIQGPVLDFVPVR